MLYRCDDKQITESEINKKLHAFKDRHYSARNVTLAVQSQETLDTLEEWVKESFGSVPVSGQDRESFGHLLHPFQTDRFHKVFKVAPIQNVYQLDLNWVLPPLLDKYRCKPLHYLSWIIGHEGRRAWESHAKSIENSLLLCIYCMYCKAFCLPNNCKLDFISSSTSFSLLW